jgi:hypothetical protein
VVLRGTQWPKQARNLEKQVDLGQVVRERTDLAARKGADDCPQRLPQTLGVCSTRLHRVDDPARGFDEESTRARGEVEHLLRLPLVAFDSEDAASVLPETGTVEHEPDDTSRREELTEPVAVDVFYIGFVQRAEDVCVELPERLGRERIEDVDERVFTRSVPVVVVVAAEQPWVLLLAMQECLA